MIWPVSHPMRTIGIICGIDSVNGGMIGTMQAASGEGSSGMDTKLDDLKSLITRVLC